MICAMKKFHERLREARKTAGFSSQEKFAEAIGMKRTQYLLYETGEVTPDPMETIPKIAKALGEKPERLKAWLMIDEYGRDTLSEGIKSLTTEEKFDILLELLPREELLNRLEKELKKRGKQ